MPDPSDKTASSDIQHSYHEAIVKNTRFLISAGIILFTLIVIVGQELREYRTRQANLAKQIKATADDKRKVVNGDKRSHVEGLENIYPKICKDVHQFANDAEQSERTDKTSESLERFIRVPRIAPEEDQGDQIDDSAAKINVTFAELVEGCDKFKEREKITDAQETFPHGTGGIRKPADLDTLVRDEEKLSALVAVLEQGLEKEKEEQKKEEKNKPKSGQRPKLNNHAERDLRLVKNLSDYGNKYRRFIDLTRELFTLTEQSQTLKSAKNSIPTPFGNFDIAPRLALLGLAYATILAYFSFYAGVRKIRRLASDYSSASGEVVSIPAPFWSPNPAPTQKGKILLSMLVHVVWLSAAIWLTVECVFTWAATKVLAFDYRSFWEYLLIALLLATIIAGVWLFLPQHFKGFFHGEGGADGSTVRINRRRFIGAGIVGAVGLLTFGVYRFLRTKAPSLPRKALAEFTANPEIVTWIQRQKNKKQNQIIHHVDVCADHLPADHNRTNVIAGERVHVSYQARIFEEFGKQAQKRMLSAVEERRKDKFSRDKFTESGLAQAELAIAYFKKAIDVSPLSIHLYDRLRRVYGSLERYDEIQKLFSDGLSRIKRDAVIAKATGLRRRQAKLRRAEKALSARLKTNKDRAERAKKRKEKREQSRETNGNTPA